MIATVAAVVALAAAALIAAIGEGNKIAEVVRVEEDDREE